MPRRTNHVQRIKKEHSVDEFIDALEADGCVLVEDFVSPEISRRVHTAEDQQPQEEFNETTVDVNALVRESFVSDRLFESISSHFLTLETLSWQDKQIQMDVSQPSVYSSITKSANQHSKPQCFHRADSRFHVRHIAAARYEYQPRRDASIGLFVPDFDDAQSSATIKVVPGSQLWNDQKPDFSKGVVEVELREGDALILLGSLYHSVSSSKLMMDVSNTASKRDTGFLHEVWMCSGIYRSA
ncbi:hypothetical protein H2198_003193 [Neophaeococcomyces mojaviensis]|uniref:Uncharacterized protein n=1 Tax=Neophaeococcomyces mojaviensis TaxID=3383035 RepID=A0ACC3ACN1_9EURO|nr:hypothetical protein H2198_003193 [Knufia sp. JES_112]